MQTFFIIVKERATIKHLNGQHVAPTESNYISFNEGPGGLALCSDLYSTKEQAVRELVDAARRRARELEEDGWRKALNVKDSGHSVCVSLTAMKPHEHGDYELLLEEQAWVKKVAAPIQ